MLNLIKKYIFLHKTSDIKRISHRQDQAVLTLLLYKYIFRNVFIRSTYIKTNFICGILFHKKKMFDT